VFYFERKYGTQSLTAGKIYSAPCLRIKNKKDVFFSVVGIKTTKQDTFSPNPKFITFIYRVNTY